MQYGWYVHLQSSLQFCWPISLQHCLASSTSACLEVMVVKHCTSELPPNFTLTMLRHHCRHAMSTWTPSKRKPWSRLTLLWTATAMHPHSQTMTVTATFPLRQVTTIFYALMPLSPFMLVELLVAKQMMPQMQWTQAAAGSLQSRLHWRQKQLVIRTPPAA